MFNFNLRLKTYLFFFYCKLRHVYPTFICYSLL